MPYYICWIDFWWKKVEERIKKGDSCEHKTRESSFGIEDQYDCSFLLKGESFKHFSQRIQSFGQLSALIVL